MLHVWLIGELATGTGASDVEVRGIWGVRNRGEIVSELYENHAQGRPQAATTPRVCAQQC